MSSLPTVPKPGQKIPVSRIIEEIRTRTISGGGMGLVRHHGSGILIGKRPTALLSASRRGGLNLHPFKVSNATTEEDGAQVKVRFGMVNSTTPTIDDVPLDDVPAPLLAVVTGVIYLAVTVDEEDGSIITATVENAAELPENTATEGYLALATVTVEDDAVTAIAQSVTHSLEHRRCGTNDHHFWGL